MKRIAIALLASVSFSSAFAQNPSPLISGSSVVIGATNANCLYNNNGILGDKSCGSGGTPGGSNTDIQFNNNGVFGGDSGFTYSGSGIATLGTSLSIAGATIGSNVLAASGTYIFNIPQTDPGPGVAHFLVNGNAVLTSTNTHENGIQLIGTDNQFPAIVVDAYGTESTVPMRSTFDLRAARGTGASPLATDAWDEIGRISGRGFDGTNFTGSVASISYVAAENYTSIANGGYIAFRTTALGNAGGGSASSPPAIGAFTPAGGFVVGPNFFTYNTNTNTQLLNDPGAGNALLQGSLQLQGTGSGYTQISGNNVGSSNFTATVPSNTGTLAELNLAQTWSATQTYALGSISAAQQAISITATFNAATVFSAPLLENITNTSSSAGSKIADFQIGGNDVLSVSANTPSFTFPGVLINATGATPSSLFYSTADALDVQGARENITNFGGASSFSFNAPGGTAASPAATASSLGTFVFRGYNGTGIATGAQMFVSNINTWSGTDTSAYFRFFVTAGGSTTNIEQLDLKGSGGLSVGTANISTDPGTGNIIANGQILTAAAPTVAASQIGLGNGTATTTNCGSLAGATACMVINVAGTTHYIPYY